MHKQSQFDVLVIGTTCIDLVFSDMLGWPMPGEEIAVKNFAASCGAVFNVAATASRLGLRVGLLTILGNDFLSRFILEEIDKAGISRDFVIIQDEPLQAISTCIAYNGDRGVISQELFLPTESLLPLLNTLHSLDLLCCYYTRDHMYVDAELARLHQSRSNHRRRNHPDVSVINDLAELLSQPCLKLAAYGDAGTLHGKHQKLASLFGKQVYITQTADECLEFLHPAVSKANALKTILHTYGISAEEVIAFGDNPNDIEMLRLAGLGIAMANAHQDVKAAADYITLSNMEDGVAVALNKFLIDGACIS